MTSKNVLATAAIFCASIMAALPARAMDVVELDGRLIVTGANFRYVWDTRRGGELASVEQRSTEGGWWVKGGPRPLVTPAMSGESLQKAATWYRVNSTLAWKSLDTIPALSFSTKRGAYYSGEWNVAYANADNKATLKLLKIGTEGTAAIPAPGTKVTTNEVIFQTTSRPKIFDNRQAAVPWQITQTVRVFDSGVVILELEAALPKDEVYELDWAQMGFNLDDSLYKESRSDRQALFQYNWAFPGDSELAQSTKRPVIQGFEHQPLDIDTSAGNRLETDNKPILFGAAAYDTTHVKGSGWNGFAECSLEDARSIVGTTADFGSLIMRRPQAGMSPPPLYAGSRRPEPCFGLMWHLFDGPIRGLNEPMTYRNRMVFAFGERKRSNLASAPTDDRNMLLGARIYYAKGALPSAADIKTMAAEGCDTLILGPAWQKDAGTPALVEAAHAANMRVGATIDAKNFKTLLADTTWFTKLFQKNRDGLLVTNCHFLSSNMAASEFDAAGSKAVFKPLDVNRNNAVSFALSMRALRNLVGPGGFMVAQEDAPGPTLLGMAECDAFTTQSVDAYRAGTPQERCLKRYRAGAGFAPMVDSLSKQVAGLAAMHGDTPIILWPPKDKQHAAWWKLCQKMPPGRTELSLLAAERRFESSGEVHGMLMQGADGKGLLLLSAARADSGGVSFGPAVESIQSIDGTGRTGSSNLDAGDFQAWQIKAYDVVFRRESSQ